MSLLETGSSNRQGQVLAACIAITLQANRPAILWGDSGEGKSSMVKNVALQMGYYAQVFIPSRHDPCDLSLPVPVDGYVHSMPSYLGKQLAEHNPSVIVLDELTCARPAMQAPMMALLQDRELGDYVLPEHVRRFAIANPPEIATDGYDLAAPVANRLVHLEFATSHDDWREGCLTGIWQKPSELPKLSANWTDHISAATALVISFLDARRELVRQRPEDPAKAGKAWPSRRSWSNAMELAGAVASLGWELGSDVGINLLAGCVGQGPALELAQFVERLDLPTPEELLKKPSLIEAETAGDRVHAMLSGLVAYVLDGHQDDWLKAFKVMSHAAKIGHADLAAANCSVLVRNKPSDVTNIPLADIAPLRMIFEAAGLGR